MSNPAADASIVVLFDSLYAHIAELRAMSQAKQKNSQKWGARLNAIEKMLGKLREQILTGDGTEDIKDAEERALRDFINQIEERIEALARQHTDDVIAKGDIKTQLGEDSDEGPLKPANLAAATGSN